MHAQLGKWCIGWAHGSADAPSAPEPHSCGYPSSSWPNGVVEPPPPSLLPCHNASAMTALLCGFLFVTTGAVALPLPFTRVLRLAEPAPAGRDVVILQHFLRRAGNCSSTDPPGEVSGKYDAATARAVACFQARQGLTADGVLGLATADEALRMLSADGWQDDGRSAAQLGNYKYKITLPVHTNRCVETVATLFDAHNNVLLRFPARTHGHDADASGQRIDGVPWPDLTDNGCPNSAAKQGCVGLNQFSTDGATAVRLSHPRAVHS